MTGLLVFICCAAIVSLVGASFITAYFFPKPREEDYIVWTDDEDSDKEYYDNDDL